MNDWDGTPWAGEAVTGSAVAVSGPPPGAARVVAKAATGWQDVYNPLNVPQSALSRSPLKRMREAQGLYWNHPWIGSAEDAVTRKVSGMPWHLEDSDKETVDDEERDPRLKVIRGLLEKPQAALAEDQRQVGYETWNTLVKVTSRHMGLCGPAYWYLDQLDSDGLPAAILYVNPARLWPVTNDAGRLLGYVLDPKDDQGRGGTPLERREIVPFYLTPPDWGALPTGLVERTMLKARITTLADQYAAYVLGTGGRIPGIVSPKDSYISDADQFNQLVADFRAVNEAPDAAKRTTILRGPIDFKETAGNPSDLDLLNMAKMNRDDIMAIWGMPSSQAGVSGQTVGLNSGETRRYEYQILMQGPVHDRVDVIRSTIQLRLLDRWQAVGLNPQLVIEEPSFDDNTVPYELAHKAREQPLTVNERRAILELDPLPEYGPDGEPLGLAIVLPAILSTFGQGGEQDAPDGNPFANAPRPEPVRVLPVPQLSPGPPAVAKAAGLDLRKTLDDRIVPAMQRAIQAVLGAQRAAVVAKLRSRGAAAARKPEAIWDGPTEDRRLAKALRPHVAGIAATVTTKAAERLGQRAKADPFADRVEQELLTRTGLRIVGINATTRDAVADAIRQGFADGLTVDEVATLIEELPTFDAARAELVARTESGYAYNHAAVESYREFGIERVEVIDGDFDAVCAAAAGQTWTLDEANANPLGHPNCTRDFAPVFGGA